MYLSIKKGEGFVLLIVVIIFAHRTSEHHLYILYDVRKHSEVTLEVGLIHFYTLTYLR